MVERDQGGPSQCEKLLESAGDINHRNNLLVAARAALSVQHAELRAEAADMLQTVNNTEFDNERNKLESFLNLLAVTNPNLDSDSSPAQLHKFDQLLPGEPVLIFRGNLMKRSGIIAEQHPRVGLSDTSTVGVNIGVRVAPYFSNQPEGETQEISLEVPYDLQTTIVGKQSIEEEIARLNQLLSRGPVLHQTFLAASERHHYIHNIQMMPGEEQRTFIGLDTLGELLETSETRVLGRIGLRGRRSPRPDWYSVFNGRIFLHGRPK